MKKEDYKIGEDLVGIRLDKAISLKDKDISRMAVQRLIDEENILVNGKKAKSSYKLNLNDIVTITKPDPKEIEIKPENIPLDVVYEDNDILVVNKQKGLVVHPGNGNLNGTLVNAVMARCKNELSGIGGEIRPGIVHRLDKDTSGLLIIAKNDKSHIKLSNEFKNHEVKKTYIALVRGRVKENMATIDMPIARSTKDRTKMAVSKNGKNAITHIKVLERFKNYTLLKVNIETGRTHQIRVHLSHIGHPVYNDTLYGFGKVKIKTEEQVLEAYKLKFTKPFSNEIIELEIPMDEKLTRVLNYLKQNEIKEK